MIKKQFISMLEKRVNNTENGGLEDHDLKSLYESDLLIDVIEFKYNNLPAIQLLNELDNITKDIYFNINTKKYIYAVKDELDFILDLHYIGEGIPFNVLERNMSKLKEECFNYYVLDKNLNECYLFCDLSTVNIFIKNNIDDMEILEIKEL